MLQSRESDDLPPLHSAILLAVLAFLSFVLCLPPLICHISARNLPAIVLVVGIIICNAANFINAIIWPNYPLDTRWNGQGLCDVEVKLFNGINFAIPGAVASIFRQLARILDTNKPFIRPGKYDTLKDRIFEIGLCLVFPVCGMVLHYIVQPNRYWIAVVTGCTSSFYPNWAAYLLIAVWPIIISLVGAAYCVIGIFRLLKYRRSVSSNLSGASTITKARYIRLFGLSSGLFLVYIPLAIYILISFWSIEQRPFSWSVAHPSEWSDNIIIITAEDEKTRAPGRVDRWAYVGTGFLMFLLFGLGQEAGNMYKTWVAYLGLARWWAWLSRRRLSFTERHPRLHASTQPSTSRTSNDTERHMVRDAVDVELARIDNDEIGRARL